MLNWLRKEEGQDLTEYALIISLIIIMALAAVQLLGGSIGNFYNSVVATLQNSF